MYIVRVLSHMLPTVHICSQGVILVFVTHATNSTCMYSGCYTGLCHMVLPIVHVCSQGVILACFTHVNHSTCM